MQPEAYVAIASVGGSMVTTVGVVITAFIARGAKHAAKSAGDSADQAVANTVPVSNGFTARMDTKLDHLIAVVGEVRGDFETYREEHDKRHDRDDRSLNARLAAIGRTRRLP